MDYQETTLWIIKAISDEKTQEYKLEIQPDESLIINPMFKKFISQKLDKQKYLCFTCDTSKQGQIIKWLISKGLPYTKIPNIFIDDDTVNIMTEVNLENCDREDVLFLLSKYKSTYSIFNILINEFLSSINSYWARNEFKKNLPKLNESKLKMCDSIINTIKHAMKYKTDEPVNVPMLRMKIKKFEK